MDFRWHQRNADSFSDIHSSGMLKAMRPPHTSRIGIIFLALSAALPAVGDTQFRIRKMTRDDVPLGKGQCDIRLQVDNEVEVSVRGDTVYSHTLAGRDAY